MNGWAQVATILAVYRMTRLVTTDKVTRPIRDRLIRWSYRRTIREMDTLNARYIREDLREDATTYAGSDDDAPALAYAITCWWCSSIYCAGLAVLLWWLVPDVWWPVSVVLALSAVTGLIHGIEEAIEP